MTPEQTFSVLQRVARQQGRAVQGPLTLFVLERSLARLGESSFADSFVLRPGILSKRAAGLLHRRPTAPPVDQLAAQLVAGNYMAIPDKTRTQGVIPVGGLLRSTSSAAYRPRCLAIDIYHHLHQRGRRCHP